MARTRRTASSSSRRSVSRRATAAELLHPADGDYRPQSLSTAYWGWRTGTDYLDVDAFEWPTAASSVTIVSGIEARMIEAEAQQAAGDPAGEIATLNAARATVTSLTPLSDRRNCIRGNRSDLSGARVLALLDRPPPLATCVISFGMTELGRYCVPNGSVAQGGELRHGCEHPDSTGRAEQIQTCRRIPAQTGTRKLVPEWCPPAVSAPGALA